MRSDWIVLSACIILVLNCELVKCDLSKSVKELSNYQSEKTTIFALSQTVVIILDSAKESKSFVYTARYPHHKQNVDDITEYFKGHVNDFIVQPQKQMAIFTETNMNHIVVLRDDSTVPIKIHELNFVPSKISIPMNNNEGNFFIILDKTDRKLHFTQSGGRKFQYLIDNVQTFEWQYDDGKNFLLVERRQSLEDPSSSLEYIELTPIFNKVLKFVTLADQVRHFNVNGNFIIIHRANDTLLYHKRQQFIRTIFYPVFRPQNLHLIDTDKNSIKIIAENDQESRFYIGNYYANSRSIRFELSLADIEKDYLTKIDSAEGVYVATQNNAKTSIITFDNGRTWNETKIMIANNKIYSSKLVPGVIVVTIGQNFMVSKDGGKSWSNMAEPNFTYLLNNNMGIIVGTDLVSYTETLKYSTTYGSRVADMVIYEKPLTNQAVYSKEDSMDFYLVAHDAEHNNYLTRIDFTTIFTKPCSEFDYDLFATDVCILGQKVTYKRRKNLCAPEQQVIANNKTCDCSFGDYDCDTNFGRTYLSLTCNPEPGIPITTAVAKCHPGDLISKTSGYLKIESSVCIENYKSLYAAEITVCPYTKVDYLLAKTGNTLKLYDENMHQVKNLHYYGYESRESYEFDLINAMMFETNHTVVKHHSTDKHTHGKILVRESVLIHNLKYDWISGWLFYIVEPPMMIKAFPTQQSNVTHSKILTQSNEDTQVTSLTLHVVKKYIYWRTGNNFNRASLKYNPDNSDVKIVDTKRILADHSIGSDLTIDYITDHLYFYSTQEGSLIQCSLYGIHCKTLLKLVYSDSLDLSPTNAFQIAISHKHIYFYSPQEETVEYWDRTKDYTDLVTKGHTLFKHKISEMKFVSKSIQLYAQCLVQHSNSALCTDVLNLNKTPAIIENVFLTETICPDSKYCDGVFDCFFGEDEQYCVTGPEEFVKIKHHKIYWIGIVLALGVISFLVGSVLLYKRTRAKFTAVRYNAVENKVLFDEADLEDDESDIEMLFS